MAFDFPALVWAMLLGRNEGQKGAGFAPYDENADALYPFPLLLMLFISFRKHPAFLLSPFPFPLSPFPISFFLLPYARCSFTPSRRTRKGRKAVYDRKRRRH